jgi:hypothetical protein
VFTLLSIISACVGGWGLFGTLGHRGGSLRHHGSPRKRNVTSQGSQNIGVQSTEERRICRNRFKPSVCPRGSSRYIASLPNPCQAMCPSSSLSGQFPEQRHVAHGPYDSKLLSQVPMTMVAHLPMLLESGTRASGISFWSGACRPGLMAPRPLNRPDRIRGRNR